jgi:nucleotide-binding universal stress UspA family protein
MSKPIIVGYDPVTADRAPVHFGVAAARFTGASLIVASVSAAGDRPSAGQQDEDLVLDASEALAEAERELEPEGIPVECRGLTGTSAARALHEAAEAEDAGLLVVGSRSRARSAAYFPTPPRSGSCTARHVRSRSSPPAGKRAAASTQSAWRTSTRRRAARRCAARTPLRSARAPRCASSRRSRSGSPARRDRGEYGRAARQGIR